MRCSRDGLDEGALRGFWGVVARLAPKLFLHLVPNPLSGILLQFMILQVARADPEKSAMLQSLLGCIPLSDEEISAVELQLPSAAELSDNLSAASSNEAVQSIIADRVQALPPLTATFEPIEIEVLSSDNAPQNSALLLSFQADVWANVSSVQWKSDFCDALRLAHGSFLQHGGGSASCIQKECSATSDIEFVDEHNVRLSLRCRMQSEALLLRSMDISRGRNLPFLLEDILLSKSGEARRLVENERNVPLENFPWFDVVLKRPKVDAVRTGRMISQVFGRGRNNFIDNFFICARGNITLSVCGGSGRESFAVVIKGLSTARR